MVEAVMTDEKDKIEVQQQLMAWQTSLLMNATGNFKKQIKPEDLFSKEKDADLPKGVNRIDRDEKNRKIEELQEKFNQTTN